MRREGPGSASHRDLVTVSSWVLWRRENGLEIGLGLSESGEEKEGRKRKAKERDGEGVWEVRGKIEGGRFERGKRREG